MKSETGRERQARTMSFLEKMTAKSPMVIANLNQKALGRRAASACSHRKRSCSSAVVNS
jgi:hypothetical protein